jgi:hypothetical protein
VGGVTAVLAQPVLARRVAAIQVPVFVSGRDGLGGRPDEPDIWGDTWRWRCTCGVRSFCTFATADEADRYGQGHQCRATL